MLGFVYLPLLKLSVVIIIYLYVIHWLSFKILNIFYYVFFFQRCGTKSFCKTRGIPECILLVTQRITKYSLLIDALIKTTKG